MQTLYVYFHFKLGEKKNPIQLNWFDFPSVFDTDALNLNVLCGVFLQMVKTSPLSTQKLSWVISSTRKVL